MKQSNSSLVTVSSKWQQLRKTKSQLSSDLGPIQNRVWKLGLMKRWPALSLMPCKKRSPYYKAQPLLKIGKSVKTPFIGKVLQTP